MNRLICLFYFENIFLIWKNAKTLDFLLVKHIKDARILSPIKFNTVNNMLMNNINNL